MGNRNWGVFVLGAGLSTTAPSALGERGWPNEVELSGLIEVEANLGANYADQDFSDIVLAMLELGLDATVSERVSAHVLLLHEDGATEPMEVDEGTITLDYGAVSLSGGRMYVPFGVFETHMISDPLTLEIGETRETAVQVAFGRGGLYGSVYAFNGTVIQESTAASGEDTIEGLGATVGFGHEREQVAFDVGIDFINNIADSDSLSELLDASVGSEVQSYVSGVVVHGQAQLSSWGMIAEYLQSDSFATGELDFRGRGAELAALNLEVGYTFTWTGKETTLAAAYQMTEEAIELGLPKERILFGMGVLIEDDTMVKLEYAMDEDYGVEDGGTGQDASNLTAQLAVEF